MINLDSQYVRYLAEYLAMPVDKILDAIFDQYQEDITLYFPHSNLKIVLTYKPLKERDYEVALDLLHMDTLRAKNHDNTTH